MWKYFSVDTWENQCKDCRAETYRLFSLQFVHAGISHLVVNLIGLLFYGSMLEPFQGGLVTGLIFQLGVGMGAIGQHFYYAFGTLVGCSGGVYALIGANLSNAILNGDVMKTPARVLVGSVLTIQLLLDSILYLANFSTTSGYPAHFSGFVVGALAVPAFGHTMIPTNKKLFVRGLCSICLIILIVCMTNSYITDWPPSRHYALPFHPDTRASCCEDALVLVTVQGLSVEQVIENYYCDGFSLVQRGN